MSANSLSKNRNIPSPLALSGVPTTLEDTKTINQSTVHKLHEMRLSAMAEAYRNQLSDNKYQDLSFEGAIRYCCGSEWARRNSNKLLRLIKKADFRYLQASIEDIEYHPDRKLDKTSILRLSGCAYIREKRNFDHRGRFRQWQILHCLCLWHGGLPQLLQCQVYPATGTPG